MHENCEPKHYLEDSYNHILDIFNRLKIEKGVNLDLGCNLDLLYKGIEDKKKFPVENIGLSKNSEIVKVLCKRNFEAYEYDFLDSKNCDEYINKILDGRKITSITIINIEQNLSELLAYAYGIAKKYEIPLVITAINATNKNIVLELCDGNFEKSVLGFCDRPFSFFTEMSLLKVMEINKFQEIAKNDLYLHESNGRFICDSIFSKKETLVSQYVSYIKDLVDKNASTDQFIRAYLTSDNISIEKEQTDEKIFLSIITRTQGKRKQELSEMLLCLTGQTNIDFELLILGHKLGVAEQEDVNQIIEDLPNWMRERTRLISVNYGTRTTPLNVGFSNAKGEYICILDDDDLVMDNWVEEFYQASKKNPGTVLHAYVISQEWESCSIPTKEYIRAVSSPSNIYCNNFDYIEQVCENHCPIIGIAFPAYAYKNFEIKFDEKLTTTEDWDFLMRTAYLCGVTDIKEPTSIYRRWKNSENSQTLHDKEEWKLNKKIIIEKFNNMPLIFPKGYATRIQKKLSAQNRGTKYLMDLDMANDAQLFLGVADGFSEKFKVYSEMDQEENSLKYTKLDKFGSINGIRFDPTELGMITVEELEITVFCENEKIERYYLKDFKTNGIRRKKTLYFFKSDPQIILYFPKKRMINKVEIKCSISSEISNEDIEKIVHRKKNIRVMLYKKLKKLKAHLKYLRMK